VIEWRKKCHHCFYFYYNQEWKPKKKVSQPHR